MKITKYILISTCCLFLFHTLLISSISGNHDEVDPPFPFSGEIKILEENGRADELISLNDAEMLIDILSDTRNYLAESFR